MALCGSVIEERSDLSAQFSGLGSLVSKPSEPEVSWDKARGDAIL
jgi:hypothetical protein